jgi:hypothetical protein
MAKVDEGVGRASDARGGVRDAAAARGDGAPDATGDARQRPWARVLATISLVVGIVGVGLSWVPLVGRLVASACAALGLVCGVVAVRATPAGAKGSRHAVAVVGVTLACVCLFEALRLTGCSAITGTVTGAAQNLVAGAVS